MKSNRLVVKEPYDGKLGDIYQKSDMNGGEGVDLESRGDRKLEGCD